MIRRVHVLWAALVALVLLRPAPAGAEQTPAVHGYALVVGYNGVGPGEARDKERLRFADDDAIAFYAFVGPTVERGHLLTAIDVDSQRRLGGSVPAAVPPTLVELRKAVADIAAALDGDKQAGVPTYVYFYYSGHGSAAPGQEPALTLMDGALTQSVLYDEVLAKLPATRIHVFVDACHAEAVVRPRDLDATSVETSDDDRKRYVLDRTLARFPNAGAIMAATQSAEAHEWENYLGGIFTHELLSGLRGGADVDGDGRIEYSELAAFLAAANGSVRDPRARLETVTHAPIADARAAIVDLRGWPASALLESRATLAAPVYVEDDRGDRLLDLRPERNHAFRLVLPAGRALYIHAGEREAEVRPRPGERMTLEKLEFFPASPGGARGALEAALHSGLFATSFGPSYYRGFIDSSPDLAPIPLEAEAAETADTTTPFSLHDEARASGPGPRGARTFWAYAAAGTGGALAIGAGVFGAMALSEKSDFDHTSIERRASADADRYNVDTAVAIALGSGAVVLGAAAIYFLVGPTGQAPPVRGAGIHGVAFEF
jgi:hypothetical protein